MESDKVKQNEKQNEPADFELAIESTGYGKFHYSLLLIAMPCCFASVFETTTMSLILPSAECDLSLSLVDKGMLNAITYAGMISSAFLWGFLSDVLGRKMLLVYGYLLDAMFNICSAFSQSFVAILVFKFMGGFIICGPFAVLMSYLSELHGLKYRSRVMMSTGIFFSIASIILPSLAWAIIPHPRWNFKIVEDYFELHTWQTFLLVCAVPSLLSGILVSFLPESPKFLMSKGRNEEAMKVFKRIHRLNMGAGDEYPVKSLVNEKVTDKRPEESSNDNKKSRSKLVNGIRGGFSQMSVMLEPPHLKNACLVYTIQFFILFGLNTFRLWVVQLFAIIKEYEDQFATGGNETDADLCTMIEFKVNKTLQTMSPAVGDESITCEPNLNGDMFLNTMLISVIQLGLYMVSSAIINAVGNKVILICGLMISGTCGIALYWAKDTLTTLLLSSGYISIASISSTTLVGSVVSMFPTATRTMNVSLVMMFGRSGAIIGNILFPWLMSMGCFPPFAMIGATALVCSLICFLIPKVTKKPLE